jgi:hypothetical protein
MENFFEITIGHGQDLRTLEVKDYVHHEGDKCKFEVYELGKLVVTLEPDGHSFKVCKNPANVDEGIVHIIIDKIEAYHL